MRQATRIALAVCAAGAVTLGLAGAGTAGPRSPGAALDWSVCPGSSAQVPSLAGFQCAHVQLPLDYSDPAGRQVTLGVVKHPAREPAARLGTVFFNPGGPGDLGSEFLPALLDGFPVEVVDRFDIVSWDPRGMGGMSTPVVQCLPSQQEESSYTDRAPYPPITPGESVRYAVVAAALNRVCVSRDPELLAHVSTADSARDLDRLRQLVGEERIRYYGTSYGTFLGATYRAMFPEHVLSMVIDGAVDPNAWTRPSGGLSTFLRMGSDLASARAADEFLVLCGRQPVSRCAFSAGAPNATRAKFRALLHRAARGGITIPGEGTVTRGDIVGFTIGSLYVVEPVPGVSRFPGWTALAEALQQVWEASAGRTARAALLTRTAASVAATAASESYVGVGPQLAVMCSESPAPQRPVEYLRGAAVSWARSGIMGSPWPWGGYCAGWTARAASPYLGPWTSGTSPLLVIGVTGDLATPYSNAVSAAGRLGGTLVTVKGQGHTQLANPSSCAQIVVADLFIRGITPAISPRCRQDTAPFSG